MAVGIDINKAACFKESSLDQFVTVSLHNGMVLLHLSYVLLYHPLLQMGSWGKALFSLCCIYV